MGIIQPDEGKIEILGEPFSESLKEKIGYLPEERGLYRKMKVLEHLVFLAEIKGLPAKTAAERARSWLERVDLGGWEDKPVEALSKGMQQKIQFISTIIHEPQIVILDEPFTGLDPINTQMLKDVIVEMKNEGRTVILSTHLMEQVEKLCEKICLINKGRKVLEGGIQEIKMRFSKNVVAMRFTGDVSRAGSAPRRRENNGVRAGAVRDPLRGRRSGRHAPACSRSRQGRQVRGRGDVASRYFHCPGQGERG